MRPRVFPVLIALALVACSSSSDLPSAASSSSPSPTPTRSIAPGTIVSQTAEDTPRDTPSVEPSSTTGTTAPAPAQGAPGPGLYTYRQSGEFRPAFFHVPDEGTLRIYASTAEGEGRRQRQVRAYSPNQNQEQILIFRRNAILLERVSQRYGSGSYAQTFECAIDPPLLAIKLPMTVGARWQDSASCSGLTMTYSAEVQRRATRTVGGIAVETFVVRTVADASGDGIEQHTVSTLWISPLYRLAVRSVSTSDGSSGGFSFSSSMTDDLVSLTPAR